MSFISLDSLVNVPKTPGLDIDLDIVPLESVQAELAAEGRLYNCEVTDEDLGPSNGFFLCYRGQILPLSRLALTALQELIPMALDGRLHRPSHLERLEAEAKRVQEQEDA